MGETEKLKSKRGFAERRREIASMGGKSVPALKRSFSQNADLAVKSGHKGGKAVNSANRAFAQTGACVQGGHQGRPRLPWRRVAEGFWVAPSFLRPQ